MKRFWTVRTPGVDDIDVLVPIMQSRPYTVIDFAGDERTEAPPETSAVVVFGSTQYEADTRAQAIVDALALAAQVQAAKPARQSLPRRGATSGRP